MNRRYRLLFALFAIMMLAVGTGRPTSTKAAGSDITITFVATVEDVYDSDNLLGGVIQVGDVITGKYTYDAAMPDANDWDEIGDYWYTSSPYGIEVHAGGLVFQTDPNNVGFLVEIVNDYDSDNYVLHSYNNLPLPTGAIVDHISWQLNDWSQTALSSDALPTTPPNLADWESGHSLIVEGGTGDYPYGPSYAIIAPVTEVRGSTLPVLPPEEQIELLTSDVEHVVAAGNLTVGQGDALIAKLDAANRALVAQQTRPALQQLGAFITQTKTYVRTGILQQHDGQPLINAANNIVGQLES